MMKWMLAVGAAALAISSPAAADKGQGGGKGHGGQAAQKGGGGGKGPKAQGGGGGGGRQATAKKGGGGGQHSFHAQSGGGHGAVKTARGGGGDRAARAQQHGHGQAQARQQVKGGSHNKLARIEHADRGGKVRMDRGQVKPSHDMRFAAIDRGNGNRDNIIRVRDVDRGVVRFRDVDRDSLFVQRLGYGAGGCPPGLASKGCMPPGQAAKLIGSPLVAATRFGALEPLPTPFRSLYYDNDDYYYRYGGGYLYRVDRNDSLIAGMLPLFGAALVGQPLAPSYVNPYNTPPYFSAFYPNSQYDCYRNGYGYVYETNCATGFVEDVIPTYENGYGVGQLMPASYSYYNVPYQYRSYYSDNDDYYYRYAPGAIYQVDRGTALISAVASLLTGGLSVGQQLPVGYSAYNVPMAYRSTYYDSPNVMYRYDNGYIYAVDPGTRMVRSVAYTIV